MFGNVFKMQVSIRTSRFNLSIVIRIKSMTIIANINTRDLHIERKRRHLLSRLHLTDGFVWLKFPVVKMCKKYDPI